MTWPLVVAPTPGRPRGRPLGNGTATKRESDLKRIKRTESEWSIHEFPVRLQPFSVWRWREVWQFTTTRLEAEEFIRSHGGRR